MPNIKGGKKHKRNKKQNNFGEKTLRLKDEGQEYAQIKKCNVIADSMYCVSMEKNERQLCAEKCEKRNLSILMILF